MQQTQRATGMSGFLVVLIGQAVSILGSAMTRFALSIWVWQQTGEATPLALVALFSFGPTVLLSPIAGVIVDRYDRKLVMMISDLVSGLTTIILAALFFTNSLALWHLYVLAFLAGSFEAFQFPAYSSAIATMIPKEQYTRANGMLEIASNGAPIIAPAAAAALISFSSIGLVFLIDIVTFVVAVTALIFVYIPRPTETEAGKESRSSFWREANYGFEYIWKRKPLFWLQMIFFQLNFFGSLVYTLHAPYILASTNGNEGIYATVATVGSLGAVVGAITLSIWGGPKRKIYGVLVGMICTVIAGELFMGLANSVATWSLAIFASAFFVPILNGSSQALWQSKVAPDVQGRVFTVRRLIAQITSPVAMLVAGPLADLYFEPAMLPGGALASLFGPWFGTGPGSGMGVIIFCAGVLGIIVPIVAFCSPMIRNIETLLPDYTQAVEETIVVTA